MAAILMDGKALGMKIRNSVKERSDVLKAEGITPCLAVILAGDNPASLSYVNSKEKALAEAGMKSVDVRLPACVKEDELLSIIKGFNNDKDVHGILVQLPLPSHINEENVIAAIDPKKDVDCFHPVTVGNMVIGKKSFLPCTPHGVLMLLKEYNIQVSGSHTVIVGRSNIVGKPLLNLLLRREYNATVSVCHTGTKNIACYTKQADILIAAAGTPAFISKDMVKDNVVIIDVGINRVKDENALAAQLPATKGYRLCGDVDPSVIERASYFTPVPGGVGPMTIAMLMQNVLEAALNYKEVL